MFLILNHYLQVFARLSSSLWMKTMKAVFFTQSKETRKKI